MEHCNTLSALPITMNSREIAELVESRHIDVMRSIDRLVERGVIRKTPLAFFEEINNLGFSVKREMYVFDHAHKRDSFIVVAQLSPEFTARLVDRWQELEAAAAKPTITDPIIAALVHGLMEIDGIKQQQVVIVRKTEQLESRVEQVELQHRNGVPQGYLSRSQAHVLHGVGLSEKVFHLALHQLEVPTTPYIHHAEDGNDVATFAYLESDIADAVRTFLEDAIQVTRCMCESPLLNGRRFRYSK
ncbi:Rha family transcriptional regulator [Chromatium okenii]|uniref:Rha family transcriptional regulator n=1 Tax=Chromatium okenii TaxID=61644 RepID=UPI0026F25E71|nr:Rha family transcriptional regulator [Chromatium okenii]MBV5309360.1 Rha family transcriptional regulator [Chromatium okenii]